MRYFLQPTVMSPTISMMPLDHTKEDPVASLPIRTEELSCFLLTDCMRPRNWCELFDICTPCKKYYSSILVYDGTSENVFVFPSLTCRSGCAQPCRTHGPEFPSLPLELVRAFNWDMGGVS